MSKYFFQLIIKRTFIVFIALILLGGVKANHQIQLKNGCVAKTMNFNFNHIPIRDVLQLLAQIGDINLVMGNDVTGVLSLHLQNVSWYEAFCVVLKMAGLIEKKQANVYFISSVNEYNRLEQQYNVQTEGEIAIKLLHIDVQEAISLVKSQAGLLSASGQIIDDIRSNMLWIKDNAEHLARIKNYLHKIDVCEKQIVIEARIVNLDDHVIDQLGLHIINRSTGFDKHDLNVSLPHAFPGKIGLVVTKIANNKLLDLELTALENTGKCKIIACPKLMTQNRKPAYIESGEEIPYQEQTSSGATNISFKKAVLSLKATPYVTPDRKILLQLEINQNKVSSLTVNGTPGITTQQVQTQVIVDDNQTVVLGGIFETSQSKICEKLPVIGDIPLVGGLLGDRHCELTKKELLVFVTPKIVCED